MIRCAAFRFEIHASSSGLATGLPHYREQVRSQVLSVTPVTAWKVAKPVSLGKAAFQSIVRLIQEIVTRFRVGVI